MVSFEYACGCGNYRLDCVHCVHHIINKYIRQEKYCIVQLFSRLDGSKNEKKIVQHILYLHNVMMGPRRSSKIETNIYERKKCTKQINNVNCKPI